MVMEIIILMIWFSGKVIERVMVVIYGFIFIMVMGKENFLIMLVK